MKKHVIGFVINPIAGMGGRVGLKGTDGLAHRAREMGAVEVSSARAREALGLLFHSVIADGTMELELLTAGHPMGEEACSRALSDGGNFNHRIGVKRIYDPQICDTLSHTTSRDTIDFCKEAVSQGAEMILFTGGDGTARDVAEGVGDDFPVLGIPSGVKMHSGVFTFTPEDAGNAVLEFMKGSASLETREVIDLDEDAYRMGEIRTRLFGYATVPVTTAVQGCKNIISPANDGADRESIALGILEFMESNPGIYIMGAGSTLKDIGEHLRVELTPLGFDVLEVENGNLSLILKDANERMILPAFDRVPIEQRYLIITPIGAQGFILGRGTQVVSDRVLDRLKSENIIVVATPGKLAVTPKLRVDVGIHNDSVKGFRKVITGYRRTILKKVE